MQPRNRTRQGMRMACVRHTRAPWFDAPPGAGCEATFQARATAVDGPAEDLLRR
jgi:hypothetical protein